MYRTYREELSNDFIEVFSLPVIGTTSRFEINSKNGDVKGLIKLVEVTIMSQLIYGGLSETKNLKEYLHKEYDLLVNGKGTMVKICYKDKKSSMSSFSEGFISKELWEDIKLFQNLFKDEDLRSGIASDYILKYISINDTKFDSYTEDIKNEFFERNKESIKLWEERRDKWNFINSVMEFIAYKDNDYESEKLRMISLIGDETLKLVHDSINPIAKMIEDKERISKAIQEGAPLSELKDIKFVKPI